MVSMISAVEANCSSGICVLNEKDKTKEAMLSNLVVMKVLHFFVSYVNIKLSCTAKHFCLAVS